jgi:hypothetical protein
VIEIPITVRLLFVAAGWYPGRTVRPSSTIPSGHPAIAILTQFGGLRVGTSGPGEECATSDVAFQEMPLEDAPRGLWAPLLRTELVGIGEVHNAHGALYVDRTGQCYCASRIHDGFSFEGASFNEAIERVLRGRCFARVKRLSDGTVRRSGRTTRGSINGDESDRSRGGLRRLELPGVFTHPRPVADGRERPLHGWSGNGPGMATPSSISWGVSAPQSRAAPLPRLRRLLESTFPAASRDTARGRPRQFLWLSREPVPTGQAATVSPRGIL